MTETPAGRFSLVLVLLAVLTGCFNDTPYTSGASHIALLSIDGPGRVTLESERSGLQVCTPSYVECGQTSFRVNAEPFTLSAVPDSGRTFIGWTGHLRPYGAETPLELIANRDYFFGAIFR